MRQQYTRVNQGVGQEQTPQAVMPNVTASQNVRAAQRDPSGVLNAVAGFQDVMAKKAAQAQAEADELSALQGQRDQLAGRVDEARRSDDRAYDEAVIATEAKGIGDAWLRDSIAQMQERFNQDPNFPIEEFQQERIREYLDNATDPADMKVRNQIAAEFQRASTTGYTALRDNLREKQARTAFATRLSGFIYRQGANLNPEAFDKVATEGSLEVALDPEEERQLVASTLIEATQLGGPGGAKAYEVAVARGLLEDAQYGPRLQAAKQAMDLKAQREAEEARDRDMVRYGQVMGEIDKSIETGRFSFNWVDEQVRIGRMTESEGKSAINRYYSHQQRMIEEARQRADKQADLNGKLQLWATGTREEFIRARASGLISDKDMKTISDLQFINARSAFLATQADTPARIEAANYLAGVLRRSQELEIPPPELKVFLNGMDTRRPAEFQQQAEFISEMEARNLGHLIRSTMSVEDEIRYESYVKQTRDFRKAPNEALRTMSEYAIPREKVADVLNSRDWVRTINPAITELQEQLGTPGNPVVHQEMMDAMTELVASGQSVESAVANASVVVAKRFSPGMFPIPNSYFKSEDHKSMFEENKRQYIDSVLEDINPFVPEGTYGPIEPFPIPNSPGKVYLLDTSTMRVVEKPKKDKDGNIVYQRDGKTPVFIPAVEDITAIAISGTTRTPKVDRQQQFINSPMFRSQYD